MSRAPLVLAAVVAHARTTPAEDRERLAAALREVTPSGGLLLETCHRVEAYVAGPEADDLAHSLTLPAGARAIRDAEAVRHAIAVGVGRDSVVVGEDQVLHQLRVAVDERRAEGRLDPVLERLFSLSLQAGRRARSWRPGPRRSLADVALDEIGARVGDLRGRRILIVGAGRMGRLATRAAVKAGAQVSIANRTDGPARDLAATTGAGVEPFDPGPTLAGFDGVVVALGGPWPLHPDSLATLAGGSTVVVDLSVPAALPATTIVTLGARHVSADALARNDTRAPDAERRDAADRAHDDRLDALIDETAAAFLDWHARRASRSAARTLVGLADREREAELEALWRRLPDLQPEARAAIDGMTRHLTKRLLRAPLERLGHDPDGRAEQAVRTAFDL